MKCNRPDYANEAFPTQYVKDQNVAPVLRVEQRVVGLESTVLPLHYTGIKKKGLIYSTKPFQKIIMKLDHYMTFPFLSKVSTHHVPVVIASAIMSLATMFVSVFEVIMLLIF